MPTNASDKKAAPEVAPPCTTALSLEGQGRDEKGGGGEGGGETCYR